MLTVDQAQEAILAACPGLNPVRLPLLDAYGHALAEEVVADAPLPPFDNSAMDGYAVLAADTSGASSEHGVSLRVLGDLPAGQAPRFTVTPGTAVRIMTGAPLPPGADAVVMVEDTRTEGETVLIFDEASAGQHIRPAGDDVAPGQTVLTAGRALDAAALAMLAAAGRSQVMVTRRPRIAVLTTGDEVVDTDGPLAPGQIRNSNRYGLYGQVRDAGCELSHLAHVGDDPEAVRAALRAAADSGDAVITTGGVSVGDYDFMKQVLQDMGQMDFWRVAVKPGKPLAFGSISGKPLFGLPGNPVSAMLTFELFVRPALRKMAGCSRIHRPCATGVLKSDVRHYPGRREFQRARIEWEEGQLVARPLSGQGSHQLFGLVASNGLIVIPEESEGVAAGETVQVIILNEGE
ncbi:MAG: molybdopterin molybdotransferase MoeA [Armatimonadetes bacterium]|nr:molybdopterin molybdotransferase MoeA [Armatimonadota bacterium]